MSSEPAFSRDVLQLEISGPDQEHLSVIDVPAIFRYPTENVTTHEDIALVRSIVDAYMVNRRSVMRVVVSANIDLANQEIFELAKGIDPEGDRKLGVLTKPDPFDKCTEPAGSSQVRGRADFISDIKPENLLFYPTPFVPTKNPKPKGPEDEDKADEGEFIKGVGAGRIGQIKIADFGLSKVI
ncbi:MAPK-activated protein kinase Srk1 [Elasticomyces elasticus]|nr:MAPK-activated protein kinase Srk1 [Elasticomyces elasticus]